MNADEKPVQPETDSKDGSEESGSENQKNDDRKPIVFDPSLVRWGPDWVRYVMLTGWVLMLFYLAYLAAYKTNRHFKAKPPFEDNNMQLKF